MKQRQMKRLGTGAIVLAVSMSAAWSLGRGSHSLEPAPLEVFRRMLGESAPAAAPGATGATEAEAVVWDLTVTRNSDVDRWINFLKGGNADKTKLWLERKARYEPMIQAELRRRGMPEDLIYLALIESGFSPKAYSRAAASGMWQFIAETGRRYGLEVSSEVDERRDPIRSTTAALDYLQALHGRFGSWYLAAAAYNTGENRVERVLRERAGGARGDDALFWQIAPYLPRETRDYVPLMLAAGHIGKQPAKYGFEELDYQAPLDFDTVWVPGATDLSMVAQASGVAESAVTDLNPHLTRGRTPHNRGYAVRVPRGTRVAFEAQFPALYRTARLARPAERERAEPRVVVASARTHRVRSGETLDGIARRYGVSVTALRNANRNVEPRRLRIGQSLRLPTSTKAVASAAGAAKSATAKKPTTKKATPSASRYHSVRRGDNLSVIASRYDVTVRQLKVWNRLDGSRIYAGQRLRVRA